MTTIHRVIITLVTTLFLSFPGWAEEGQSSTSAPSTTTATESTTAPSADTAVLLKEGHPDQYKVVKGDTLWGIANTFLKNPWMWPEIWHVNPQIANPHLIFPGDTIKLIYLEGQPRLEVKRGEAGVTYKASPDDQISSTDSTETEASAVASSSETSAMPQQEQGQPTTPGPQTVSADRKLHAAIRVLPLEEPIPAIPLNAISPFLSGSRIVNPGVLDGAPYVVEGSQNHVITGAGASLYARGDFDPKSSIYGIFRKGKVYTDPQTNEVLGIQAVDIGTGKVKSHKNDIAMLYIVRSTQEIRSGDRLLTNQERRVESTFFPSAPEANIQAQIIDVEGGVSQVGAMSVVAVNKGERDELQPGNVLAIFQRGEIVKDPLTNEQLQLMDERAGLMMIFVTFEKMSFALVLYADRPLHVGDILRKP